MSLTDAPAPPQANPWLSLWFRPRAAIDAVLAADLRWTSLAIAVATTVLGLIASQPAAPAFFAESAHDGPRALALATFIGMILLAAFVYYFDNWVLNLVAHAFGGKGTAAQTRAAAAWSAVPLLIANLAIVIWFGAGGPATGGALLATSLWPVIFSLWSFVLFVVMFARVQSFGKVRAVFSLLIGSLAPALLIAVLVRSFLFQPFNIPSTSMAPTLVIGDYLFADKTAYGYGRYSFPYDLVPIEGRWLAHAPKRGDVVIFRHEDSDFVKRVIGLPGEKIQLRAARLYIDGRLVERRPVAPGAAMIDAFGKPQTPPTYDEILPGGVSHRIVQIEGDDGQGSNTEVFEIPANAYFVLGDNRDNSMDSRFPAFGFAPFESLIGRAELIYFSRGEDKAVRTERLGTWIK